MRTLRKSGTVPPESATQERQPDQLASSSPPAEAVIKLDQLNEASLIGTIVADWTLMPKVMLAVRSGHFQTREAHAAWEVLLEAHRRGVVPDEVGLRSLTDARTATWIYNCGRFASAPNVDVLISTLQWDAARIQAARGPVKALLAAMGNAKSEPDQVRAIAKQLVLSLQGVGERPHLLAPEVLVSTAMREVEQRVAGHAVYSYGLPGLDRHDDGEQRMVPGTAPGLMTVLTGITGGGKSTMAANMALGIAFEGMQFHRDAPGRTVLFGAWEMQPSITLESLAMASLRWSRKDGRVGRGHVAELEGRVALRDRMALIAERVRFLELPFARAVGERRSGANDRNLDTIHGYVADSGCEVFFADLWERCLRDTNPDDVTQALYRQQAMLQETRVHGILLHQMRFKDVEARTDPRPTRESLKGTGAWVEVADAVLGVHWPFLHKRVDPNIIETFVLKQRYGRWPLAVEMGFDVDAGAVSGGRDINYERPGETNEMDAAATAAVGGGYGNKRKRRA